MAKHAYGLHGSCNLALILCWFVYYVCSSLQDSRERTMRRQMFHTMHNVSQDLLKY